MTTRQDIFKQVFVLLNAIADRVVTDGKLMIADRYPESRCQTPLDYVNAEIDFLYGYQHKFMRDDLMKLQDICELLSGLDTEAQ